jgi:hypothetical protein
MQHYRIIQNIIYNMNFATQSRAADRSWSLSVDEVVQHEVVSSGLGSAVPQLRGLVQD